MGLEADSNWIISSPLSIAGSLARAKGVNWQTILEMQNIRYDQSETPDQHVGVRGTIGALEALADASKDPSFTLDGFYSVPIGAAALFDYVAVLAPDPVSAIRNWVRYSPLWSNCISLHNEQTSSASVLDFTIPEHLGPNAQLTYALMALLASRLAHILGSKASGMQIEIAAREPQESAGFAKLYPGQVRFDSDVNRVYIPNQLSQTTNQNADPNLLRILDGMANRLLQDYESDTSEMSVIINTIAEGLHNGKCSIEYVASSLGMSQRSLQRFLEQRGTTFRKIVDEVRQASAERYLVDTRMQIKEIAYLLGFSDMSGFSRAVKNWFGKTPRELRKNAHAQTAQSPN